ncbi:Amidohydrolase [Symmachiella macrocystis]|uniref:Amidohydrolase n=1 Tax=Symmachiella macrocystis TaxID=2527985 RepID=A0A5C6B9K1_9PLAN|nr:amidohydrolase family protein [Symmachiella macrocystis]TWU07204.1 Amidohydrolase [Symmachiella macrocystis]
MKNALVDTNVNLSRWPFRRLPGDETRQLVAMLRRQGVTQAWAGSFDGLLHHDIAGVNQRLVDDCRTNGDGLLLPFGSVNPTLPDWQEDLRRCAEDYRMPGIRLHPNYHGYKLDDPRFARLLNLATERGLIVQLALSMEDERTQHPLLQVPHVDPAPLVGLLEKLPKLRLVMLNTFRSLPLTKIDQLAAAENIYFEIAMLEGAGGIEKLLKKVPLRRVLFGSHFPFFNFDAALLKLKESELGWFQLKAICEDNPHRLLAKTE